MNDVALGKTEFDVWDEVKETYWFCSIYHRLTPPPTICTLMFRPIALFARLRSIDLVNIAGRVPTAYSQQLNTFCYYSNIPSPCLPKTPAPSKTEGKNASECFPFPFLFPSLSLASHNLVVSFIPFYFVRFSPSNPHYICVFPISFFFLLFILRSFLFPSSILADSGSGWAPIPKGGLQPTHDKKQPTTSCQ